MLRPYKQLRSIPLGQFTDQEQRYYLLRIDESLESEYDEMDENFNQQDWDELMSECSNHSGIQCPINKFSYLAESMAY